MSKPKHEYIKQGLESSRDIDVGGGLILRDFPVGQFDLIYLDPPWQYDDKNSNGKRGAAHKYDTMTLDQLRAMPIPELLKPHSTVWMWHTTPFSFEAMKLACEAWGLELVTRGFLWEKINKANNKPFKGLGHHTRGNPEDCYIYRPKGSKMKPAGEAPDELIRARIREHSRKPDEAIQRIEQYCGDLYQDKLELFARQSRPEWVTWGNEGTKFD